MLHLQTKGRSYSILRYFINRQAVANRRNIMNTEGWVNIFHCFCTSYLERKRGICPTLLILH